MTIFDGLSDSDVQQVKSAGTAVRSPEGWALMAENTPADKAYIIVSGEASVRQGREEVARLGEGDLFGEAGVLRHRLRNATIVALTPLELLHFTDEKLRALAEEVPAFGKALQGQSGSASSGD